MFWPALPAAATKRMSASPALSIASNRPWEKPPVENCFVRVGIRVGIVELELKKVKEKTN